MFPMSKLTPNQVNLDLTDPIVESVLGVLWNSRQDDLQIKTIEKSFLPTKRGILSYVSPIFDPLGLIAPVLQNS